MCMCKLNEVEPSYLFMNFYDYLFLCYPTNLIIYCDKAIQCYHVTKKNNLGMITLFPYIRNHTITWDIEKCSNYGIIMWIYITFSHKTKIFIKKGGNGSLCKILWFVTWKMCKAWKELSKINCKIVYFASREFGQSYLQDS